LEVRASAFFSAYFARIVATKQGAKTHRILRLFFVPFFGRRKERKRIPGNAPPLVRVCNADAFFPEFVIQLFSYRTLQMSFEDPSSLKTRTRMGT
jgi:hypothetical protein